MELWGLWGCTRVVGSQGRSVVGFEGSRPPQDHPQCWERGRAKRRGEGSDKNLREERGGQITMSSLLTGPTLLLGGIRRSRREPIFLGMSNGKLNLSALFLAGLV